MVKSLRFLILLLIASMLGGFGYVQSRASAEPYTAARPLSQSVSLQAEVTGPNAEGTYHVSGSFTASGLDPTGPNNSYYVNIYAEFIGPGGRWPVFYDSQDISQGCFTLGGSCLPDVEVNGDTLGSVTIHSTQLADTEDGIALPFGGNFGPPVGATEMRIVARLEHQWGVEWPAFYYAWDVHGPQAVTALPTGTPTLTPTPTAPPGSLPTDTPTVTPTPGPCSITLSPSPAYVMPGESVEITGIAVWADGQPIANALLVIEYGTLDGSGYVSMAQTDAQGRFSFTYAAPPDVGSVTSVTVKVGVDGCPVSASVTINFGPPPTATPPPTITPTPTSSATPTSTPTPTTPTPTPTPEKEGDLTIHRVAVFQPIEGSPLAANKRTVVRVFADWSGRQDTVQAKVDLHVNGRLFESRGPVTIRSQSSYTVDEIKAGHDSIDFFLPADWVQQGELKIRAVVDPDDAVAEVDETNNEKAIPPIPVYPSRGSSIMIVMLDRNVQPNTVDAWAVGAKQFMLQTYPIPSFSVKKPYARLNAHENLALGYLDAQRVDMLRKLHNYANAKNPGNMAEFGVGLYSDAPYGSWLGKVKRGLSYPTYRNAPLVGQDYPLSLAHEIGHKYNNGVEEANSSRDGIPIPAGFRYDCMVNRVEYVDGSPGWINFMGDPHAAGVQAWVNADTYNQILRGRAGGGASNQPRTVAASLSVQPRVLSPSWRALAQFEQVLLVTGGFDENGNVVLVSPLAIEVATVEPGPGGPYTAELQAADGTVLASASFDINTDIGEYDAPNSGMFSFELPYPANAARLVLSDGSDVIYTLDRSPSPPTVSVEQPGGGSVAGEVTVSWTASDSDGDALTYAVLYSPDGGTTWYPLTLDWPDLSLPIDGAYLPGGDSAIIRVLASDGLNTTSAESPPFSVPKHAPSVTILSPAPETGPWIAGQPDTLAASADDVEDGWLPDSAYQWSSDKDGPLGQGSALHAALSAGTHTITVLVTDADGQQSSASVTLEVQSAHPLGGLIDPMICVFALGGAVALMALVMLLVVMLVWRSQSRQRPAMSVAQGRVVQDEQGRWWSQDANTGAWHLWTGRAWQPAQAPSPLAHPAAFHRWSGNAGRISCIGALILLGLLIVVVGGAVALFGFGVFPGRTITPAAAFDLTELLKIGGGVLAVLLGALMLRGGIKSIITRRAIVTDDDSGYRREVRGCSAIISGIGQFLVGLLIAAAGIGLVAVAFFQQILPLF